MPSVICRQVDAIGFMVGGDDHAAAVQHAMFAQVLFIASQHIWRRRGVGFHVVIESKPIYVTQIARLAHAKDYGLQESVKAAEHLLRRDLEKIPRPYCTLNRLK